MRQQQREFHCRDARVAERDARRRSDRRLIGKSGHIPLANGWTYTVSRWIAYTADDQVIEDVGISPRVFVPAGPGDFIQGRDPVLDWALNARPR